MLGGSFIAFLGSNSHRGLKSKLISEVKWKSVGEVTHLTKCGSAFAYSDKHNKN